MSSYLECFNLTINQVANHSRLLRSKTGTQIQMGGVKGEGGRDVLRVKHVLGAAFDAHITTMLAPQPDEITGTVPEGG